MRDLDVTQELPICEAPIHATEAIKFWERSTIAVVEAEIDREVAAQSFDAQMGHPLTFLDEMLTVWS